MRVMSIFQRCSLALPLAAGCSPVGSDDAGMGQGSGTSSLEDESTSGTSSLDGSGGTFGMSSRGGEATTFVDGTTSETGSDETDSGETGSDETGSDECPTIALLGTDGSHATWELSNWLMDHSITTDRIDPPLVDAALLDAYDVVILDQLLREYTPAEAMAFDEWVNAGGGLIALSGHSADPMYAQQWPNSILGPMGLEFQGELLVNGPVTDFLPHPTTTGLTSVTFLGGFEVVATIPGQSSVVARFPGQIPIAQAQERGLGKVFAWGDEWIEYNDAWDMPETDLLWTNILDWVASANACSM